MTTVKFTGCHESQHNWGNHTGNVDELTIGQSYEIDRIDVHSWHTKVYLVGIKGSFNSVCFEGL
jgi:hypothetical protein